MAGDNSETSYLIAGAVGRRQSEGEVSPSGRSTRALGQSGAHFVFAPDVFNRAQRDLTCLSRFFLPPRVLQSCACTYMRLKRGGLILLLLLLFLKEFIPPPQGETLQSAQVFAQKRDRRWFAWSNSALALCR